MKSEPQVLLHQPAYYGKQLETIGKFSWTPLMQESKQAGPGPSERYLHSCDVVGQKLFMLGGANSQGSLPGNELNILDLNSLKWTKVETKQYCQERSGHSCAVLNHQLYFFGGTQGTTLTSTFFKFNPIHQTWNLLQPLDTVPDPRELALLATVRESFLFLYGGIDVTQDTIFQDGYIFANNEWRLLNITDNLSPRVKIRQATCGNRLLFFGGEGPSLDNSLLFNDLHEAMIDEVTLELSFREIQALGTKPPQRTSHGMTGLTDNLLFVYGGEGSDLSGKPIVLDDIWVFDLQELMWTSVECCQGKLIPRYDFSLCSSSQGLFIFGGFDNNNCIIDSLSKIEHCPKVHFPVDVCHTCLALNSPPQSQDLFERPVTVSGGFLHGLSLQNTFAFKAFEMLIDSAELLGSTTIEFNTLKNKEDFDLQTLEFDSGQQFPDPSFLQLSGGEDEKLSRAALLMKLGAFRIGKTFFYISADEHKRKVILASVDNKYAPSYQESFTRFSYIEDISTGEMLSIEGTSRKTIIFNILKGQIDDPSPFFSRKRGHLLVIMQRTVLPTLQKAYYYELINYGRPDSDVKLYYNQKKLEMLEKMGLSLSLTPQFSLKSYLSLSKLQRNISVMINDSSEPVKCMDYLGTLEQYCQQSFLKPIETSIDNQYIEQCRLFQCQPHQYLPFNQGILIYCSGRLIQRFQCPFGELMQAKFFKKRVKKSDAARNLFDIVGVVHVSEKLGLNLTLSRVRNRLKYKSVIQSLLALVASLDPDLSGLEQQLSMLYEWRFSLGRESMKRQKRDTVSQKTT